MTRIVALLAALLLAGCVSLGIGGEAVPQTLYVLHDAAASAPRRSVPLLAALLIQPMPADAQADTVSIAYSRREHQFAFYQLSFWAERPVRQVPRLLQRRLEARGVATAVGMFGEPLRADWLLTIGVDAMYHDVSAPPGQARLALTAELFDQRKRTRVARRRFEASAPSATADAAGAAAALSQTVTRVFDALVPWLEAELQSATVKAAAAAAKGDAAAHRADERGAGSIESLPPDDPASDVAGFVEPALEDNVDAQQPPLLE